jgi:hypothetical protein
MTPSQLLIRISCPYHQFLLKIRYGENREPILRAKLVTEAGRDGEAATFR